MSGASVCILGPNGRRSTVKCTPNTTILQILEEACRKQNLKAEEFDLKHHNKVLDITTTFRFSGLPNNAQLEMVTATKPRLESEVTLAVNLENGTRLMGKFTPNEALLDVLKQLCPEEVSPDKHPVVIYTRREIYGTDLQTVTLKSLGITSGRAMLRLIHKTPEELKIQANVAAPLPSKPVEEKPYLRKFQPVERENFSTAMEEDVKIQGQAEEDNNSKPQMDFKPQQKNDKVDLLKLAKEKRKKSDIEPVKQEKKINFGQRLGTAPTGIVLTEPVVKCGCKNDEAMEVDCGGKCAKSCEQVQRPVNEEFVFLGDRNAMLFSLETAQAIPSEDLPDEFFDLTIDDAKKLLRDVRKQRHNMEHTPMLTSNLRSLEESKKQLRFMNKYKKAIIRIQFPDRNVLQGTFLPSDKIEDVIKFVREYLEDKNMSFYVYTTPPKEIVNDNKTLIELGFVPGALVHFGTNSYHASSYLRQDLRDKFTSNSVASLAAARMRNEYIRECRSNEDNEDMDYEMQSVEDSSVNVGASTSSGITHNKEYEDYGGAKSQVVTKTEKVPKWFKP